MVKEMKSMKSPELDFRTKKMMKQVEGPLLNAFRLMKEEANEQATKSTYVFKKYRQTVKPKRRFNFEMENMMDPKKKIFNFPCLGFY